MPLPADSLVPSLRDLRSWPTEERASQRLQCSRTVFRILLAFRANKTYRAVPHLPIPRLNLLLAVFFYTVPHSLIDKFFPLAVITRGVRPTDGIVLIRRARNPSWARALGLW